MCTQQHVLIHTKANLCSVRVNYTFRAVVDDDADEDEVDEEEGAEEEEEEAEKEDEEGADDDEEEVVKDCGDELLLSSGSERDLQLVAVEAGELTAAEQ